MRVATCLWFEREAEAAARFYVGLIADSAIEHVQHAPGPWPGGALGNRSSCASASAARASRP